MRWVSEAVNSCSPTSSSCVLFLAIKTKKKKILQLVVVLRNQKVQKSAWKIKDAFRASERARKQRRSCVVAVFWTHLHNHLQMSCILLSSVYWTRHVLWAMAWLTLSHRNVHRHRISRTHARTHTVTRDVSPRMIWKCKTGSMNS